MKAGTQLGAVVGKGKTVDIQVAKMPFIPSNYYTGKQTNHIKMQPKCEDLLFDGDQQILCIVCE